MLQLMIIRLVADSQNWPICAGSTCDWLAAPAD
jgi:hypothetical protein